MQEVSLLTYLKVPDSDRVVNPYPQTIFAFLPFSIVRCFSVAPHSGHGVRIFAHTSSALPGLEGFPYGFVTLVGIRSSYEQETTPVHRGDAHRG